MQADQSVQFIVYVLSFAQNELSAAAGAVAEAGASAQRASIRARASSRSAAREAGASQGMWPPS